MAGYNRIIMAGNLTRDPELKQLPSGQQLCAMGLASNRQFKNRQTNQLVQEVCFIDVDVWGIQAEHCKNYLKKGSPVLIEGRIKFDSWKEADGKTRSKHSIVADRVVFLSAGQSAETNNFESFSDEAAIEPAGTPKIKRTEAVAGAFKDEPPFSDELPF